MYELGGLWLNIIKNVVTHANPLPGLGTGNWASTYMWLACVAFMTCFTAFHFMRVEAKDSELSFLLLYGDISP